MINTELGWLAGIIDGEGCITITRQAPGTCGRKNWSYRLYLKIAMCHQETIERIKALAGCGTITVQKSPKYNTAWIWWSAAREALEVIRRVRPHLVTKALEADIAFEWGALPVSPLGGSGGSRVVSPELLAERQRLFEKLRDAKPSAKFRRKSPTEDL